MKVRTTIFLLLVLITGSCIASLFGIRWLEERKSQQIAAARERTWRQSVASFLNRQGAPLAKCAEHNCALDGAVAAILDGDRAWAEKHWNKAVLASFGANALWAYREDGTLAYSSRNYESDEALEMPTPRDAVRKLLAEGRACRFFYELPRGEAGAGWQLMEVCGAVVRAGWDADAQGLGQGLFFAGRIWDETMLREMPLLSGDDHVALRAVEIAADRGQQEPGSLLFSQTLRRWDGQPIAQLAVENRSRELQQMDEEANRLFTTVAALIVLLGALLGLALHRMVAQPLRRITACLRRRDLAPLERLQTRNSELGEIARLIGRFFEQRAELVRESSERVQTAQALQESEERLRHAHKMEAIGRLAGGVAHDFNNLLTAILGYAELLVQRLEGDPTARQSAALIRQAGEQAAGLTRQLLAFSRKQILQPKVIDLHMLVRDMQKLLHRVIGEHIEIRTDFSAVQSRVKADPNQIEQVILNLGVNARDAMPRGGRLTITTGNVTLNGHRPAELVELPPGDYVALAVGDTGEGMDAETRTRIFEPFFTTKGPGKGTGLGLATVYGIVKQSGGGIAVESERGRGSTFRVFLPLEHDALAVPLPALPPVARGAASETVLVVEDEEIVRELVCAVLEEQGYTVISAGRGSEAMSALAEHGCAPRLLITDVVMPEMNGPQVARAVRAHCPEIKVLFVSGYSEHEITAEGLEEGTVELLQKPFTPEMLVRKVREVLDRVAVA